jgi:hypothetical protein
MLLGLMIRANTLTRKMITERDIHKVYVWKKYRDMERSGKDSQYSIK